MDPAVRSFRLGPATVTVLNAGDDLFSMAAEFNVPEAVWRPRYAAVFERPLPFPTQNVHLALPGASVLVDASAYAPAPGSPAVPPGYIPLPAIPAQLAAMDIDPAGVTHVVLTHLHGDHFNGLASERDGRLEPTFPRARCYVPRADREDAELVEALGGPDAPELRALAALERRGLVELTAGDRALLPGLRLVAAPGESPGHQLVRLSAGDHVLYCVGDLYHHPVEVEQPDWMFTWCDPAVNAATRRAFAAHALAEDALLVAAHIPGVGRLRRAGDGVEWVAG